MQLYDTMNIRFGVTLGETHSTHPASRDTQVVGLTLMHRGACVSVGPTGAGKTACYHTLANVMTALRDNNSTNPSYQRVQYHVLNPKCITLGELYGEFNELTQVRGFP
jgi:hypothetical protein